jgi:two-component system sensor histidine kinase UhpB
MVVNVIIVGIHHLCFLKTKPFMPNENSHKHFLSAIIESSKDSIITVDFDGIITSWNKSAERLYGYPASEAIDQPLKMLLLSEDFKHIADNIEKIKQNGEGEIFETNRVGKGDKPLELEVTMSPVKDVKGKVIGVATIARDISERKHVEEGDRRKNLLQRLINSQEDERRRLARDLHDELGQQLVVLRLQLEAAKQLCQDQTICDKIDDIQLIAAAIDTGIDSIAWQLTPPLLGNLGFVTAIDKHVKEWSHHCGVEAELLVTKLKKIRFAKEVEAHLYRIVQEALNNVQKYAKAKSVVVILEKRDDLIVLIIEDDGIGFNLKDKMKRHKGLGLTGMNERAELIGGTLEIESKPGRGTTVYVRIPTSSMKK